MNLTDMAADKILIHFWNRYDREAELQPVYRIEDIGDETTETISVYRARFHNEILTLAVISHPDGSVTLLRSTGDRTQCLTTRLTQIINDLRKKLF